tara:strand:+ start:1361 stop:2644 length:1284 start_codon:yes stop_codon:yes gene_type:complete
MHDIRWIRDNPKQFDTALARRGLEPLSIQVIELDGSNRRITTELQELQKLRNEVSKQVGRLRSKGEPADDLISEVAELKNRMTHLEAEQKRGVASIFDLLQEIPNLPFDDVPDGEDEDDNVEIRVIGKRPEFNFRAEDHVDIGERLGMLHFERAAKLSGSRFVITSGALARMERALSAMMLDLHTSEFGYTEVNPPLLVRDEAAFGTGQLPKFSDDLFKTETDHWLIPTAEVPLTNMVAGEILAEEDLPLRFTAFTPCFRSEAGAAGKDTRGMLRQHQFPKVELVSVVHPDMAAEEHERMTACAEEVLRRLGLHYRVVLLSTGDLGFSACKTFDLEVWLPGQGRYREISSCSNCGDFQARRMNARFRTTEGKGTGFLHTLNGSGLAVGRTLIAILENYQNIDGSVTVPDALQGYMGGLTKINALKAD